MIPDEAAILSALEELQESEIEYYGEEMDALWCDDCDAPSVIAQEKYFINYDGVEHFSTVYFCTDQFGCGYAEELEMDE